MTLWTLVTLLFITLGLGIGGWILFMWGVKTGQFDDIEGPKYRMLDEGDDIPLENRPQGKPRSEVHTSVEQEEQKENS